MPNTSVELQNWATVLAAVVAVLVFVVSTAVQVRSRKLENLSRFMDVHQRLFAPGSYILENVTAMNSGTLRRDQGDVEMEELFHLMLLEVEKLAILGRNKAIPEKTQVYMFGWYARHIRTLLNASETENKYWELGRWYLDKLAREADIYECLPPDKRAKYWQ